MLFTFINTMRGDFEVHRAGCRDITKVRKNGQHDLEAANVTTAIQDEIDDLNADFGDGVWSADQFRILPCTKQPKEHRS